MSTTLLLPPRLTIEFLEELHARAAVAEPGALDGGEVTAVDGAGAQWLASAVSTGWCLRSPSQPLEKGLSLLGLTALFSNPGT